MKQTSKTRTRLRTVDLAYAALFAPHYGGEIGIIEFSAFDDHTFLLRARCSVIMICNGSIFRAPQQDD